LFSAEIASTVSRTVSGTVVQSGVLMARPVPDARARMMVHLACWSLPPAPGILNGARLGLQLVIMTAREATDAQQIIYGWVEPEQRKAPNRLSRKHKSGAEEKPRQGGTPSACHLRTHLGVTVSR
jgi:hypothetical protein